LRVEAEAKQERLPQKACHLVDLQDFLRGGIETWITIHHTRFGQVLQFILIPTPFGITVLK
jgi:hypothetical protein